MVRIRPIEPALRQALEVNGGTKEDTNRGKEVLWIQFSQLVEDSEEEYSSDPDNAPN